MARQEEVSSWTVGGIAFAGTVMILMGCFMALTGISAIAGDDVYLLTRNYAFDLDLTGWGWIQLILGVLVGLSGFYLFAGSGWARWIAIVLAMLAAIENFFLIPYNAWWSIVVIALAIWVIWSLTRPAISEAY